VSVFGLKFKGEKLVRLDVIISIEINAIVNTISILLLLLAVLINAQVYGKSSIKYTIIGFCVEPKRKTR
jgi:hypothetical protein